jgi:hypothetical protein
MADFYFPLLFLTPEFEGDLIEYPPYRLARRRWQTSTFDLATLATRHKLHLPYQAMDVWLNKCNVELAICGQDSHEAAIASFEAWRLGLYAAEVSPFLSGRLHRKYSSE